MTIDINYPDYSTTGKQDKVGLYLKDVRKRFGQVPGHFLGRDPVEGNIRAWGLQFGQLLQLVQADQTFQEAIGLVQGRTLIPMPKLANIFVLIRYYMPLLPQSDIVEFGCYKGGSAMFMAFCATRSGLSSQIIGLDTFLGMPITDNRIDLHSRGDFSGVDLDELRIYAHRNSLNNIQFVKGLFEDTTSQILQTSRKIGLAHIDCDIEKAVAYSYNAVKSRMVQGGGIYRI